MSYKSQPPDPIIPVDGNQKIQGYTTTSGIQGINSLTVNTTDGTPTWTFEDVQTATTGAPGFTGPAGAGLNLSAGIGGTVSITTGEYLASLELNDNSVFLGLSTHNIDVNESEGRVYIRGNIQQSTTEPRVLGDPCLQIQAAGGQTSLLIDCFNGNIPAHPFKVSNLGTVTASGIQALNSPLSINTSDETATWLFEDEQDATSEPGFTGPTNAGMNLVAGVDGSVNITDEDWSNGVTVANNGVSIDSSGPINLNATTFVGLDGRTRIEEGLILHSANDWSSGHVGNYTALQEDFVIAQGAGNLVVTLPILSTGTLIWAKKAENGNLMTVSGLSPSVDIDGHTVETTVNPHTSWLMMSDSDNVSYRIISKYSPPYSLTTTTTAAPAGYEDVTIFADVASTGDVTVTLPLAAVRKTRVTVKATSLHATRDININRSGADTITRMDLAGQTTLQLSPTATYSSAILESDGTSIWYVIALFP